jgi:hypothetical protein
MVYAVQGVGDAGLARHIRPGDLLLRQSDVSPQCVALAESVAELEALTQRTPIHARCVARKSGYDQMHSL